MLQLHKPASPEHWALQQEKSQQRKPVHRGRAALLTTTGGKPERSNEDPVQPETSNAIRKRTDTPKEERRELLDPVQPGISDNTNEEDRHSDRRGESYQCRDGSGFAPFPRG